MMTPAKGKTADHHYFGEIQAFFQSNFHALIIFGFSFFLYLNTIPHKYNLDDELVTRNHRLTSQGIKAIPEILTSPYYSDDAGYAYEYRPMVHISFALEHQLFGDNPHVSHFLNCLLYAVLCSLLFCVLQMLFREAGVVFPFLTALVFAAHPVHTEVVASIKNRDEILALLFSIASWGIILKYAEQKFWLALVLGLSAFVLALLSKISVFSFVVVIPFSLLFVYRLPLIKVVGITVALFLPAFFLIRIVEVNFKLRLLGAMLLVLYLGYVLNILLQHVKSIDGDYFARIKKWKQFISAEVFPFNHPWFLPVLFLSAPLAFLGSTYFFIQTSAYAGMLITAGLCLLLSLKAEGFYKWLLFMTFQIALLALQYLIYEPFIFILFLYWCYVSLLFVKSTVRTDKLIFGSLLTISMPATFIATPSNEFQRFIVFFFVTLFPIVQTAIKKGVSTVFLIIARVLTFWPKEKIRRGAIFLIKLLLLLYFLNPISEYFIFDTTMELYDFIAPILVSYLLIAFFPDDFSVKKSWLSGLLFIAYGCFCLTIPTLNKGLGNAYELKIWLTEHHFPVTGELPYSIGDKIIVQPSDSSKAEQGLLNPVLPDITPVVVDRPLDFVENPLAYTAPFKEKVASAFDVVLRYLKLLVVPYPLAFYYGYKEISPVDFNHKTVVLSMAIHVLLLLALIYFWRRNERFAFLGILIYFCTIAQFTNIYQAVPGMMGERYLLGPSIGFCMVLAYILIKVLKLEKATSLKDAGNTAKYVLAGLLSVYSLLTIARNNDWKDDYTLFSTDIKHVPQSAQAHNLFALNLRAKALSETNDPALQRQLIEESALHFKKALEIYPGFFNAAYDLGALYVQLNLPDSAAFYYNRVLQLDSSFGSIRLTLADAFMGNGRYKEAVPYLLQAIEAKPLDYQSYDKLSYTYFKLNEFEKSLAINRLAAERMPSLLDPLVNIGRTYQGMGNKDSARFYFRKVLALDSTNVPVKNLLKQVESK